MSQQNEEQQDEHSTSYFHHSNRHIGGCHGFHISVMATIDFDNSRQQCGISGAYPPNNQQAFLSYLMINSNFFAICSKLRRRWRWQWHKPLQARILSYPLKQQGMPVMTNPSVVAGGTFTVIDALHTAEGTVTIYQLPDDSRLATT